MKTNFSLKKKNWNELIQFFDQQITAGNIAIVTEKLKAISHASIPRDYQAILARLAQRCDMNTWGLKLLYPVMNNETLLKTPPTNEEVLIYSSLLIRHNLYEEASKFLKPISPTLYPEKYLYIAHAYILQWNLSEGIRFYIKYLKYGKLTHYQKTVAQLNISSCYLERFEIEQAEVLINKTLLEAKKNKYNLICGNCYEIMGQIEIHKNNFSMAKTYLEKSITYLNKTHARYRFYAKKWLCIIKALESQSPSVLSHLTQEAITIKEWESWREIELYQAFIAQDHLLLQKVIYGTPSRSYLYRIKALFKSLKIDDFYLYNKKNINQDLLAAEELVLYKKTKFILLIPPSKLIYRLFHILLHDFYRPISFGRIFYSLYPNEHFNPFTSPLKVNFAIHQLRNWINACQLPIKISIHNREYRLILSPSLTIKLRFQEKEITHKKNFKETHYFNQLNTKIKKTQRFSIKDAAQILNLSYSHTQRMINQWKNQRKIEENKLFKKKYQLI